MAFSISGKSCCKRNAPLPFFFPPENSTHAIDATSLFSSKTFTSFGIHLAIASAAYTLIYHQHSLPWRQLCH